MVINNLETNLQAILFDLTYSLDTSDNDSVMRELCRSIETLLEAELVTCYMYNKLSVGQQISSYSSNRKPYNITETPMQLFETFKHQPMIREVSNDITHTYILKLPYSVHLYGLMLFTFPKAHHLDDQLLESLRQLVVKFLFILYKYYDRKLLRSRTQFLTQLSTELHSVYKTTDVLVKMYDSIKKIYPTFSFSLLMSIDYDCKDVPIQLIEYSGKKAQSIGTLAFIENKIKVDYKMEDDETHIYSPLAGNQSVYGVLEIVMPHVIDEEEIEQDIIGEFSSMIGMAIERTTMYESSNQQVSDLQIINTASHELNVNLESENIIDILKKNLMETSNAKELGVMIYEGELEDEEMLWGNIKVLGGSTEYFYSVNGTQLVNYLADVLKTNTNALLSGNFQSTILDIPYQSLMMIPMWSENSIFGFVVMVNPAPYHFSFDTFKFAQSFIQHASLAFKNSVLKEQLQRMATIDYLTKLYLRSYLDGLVMEHLQREGSGTFVLFDVDDFKKVNDTYGHAIGDQVLIKVAKIINEKVSVTEGIAARWGGEEFAIYFPNLSVDLAESLADDIRKTVHQETEPTVTLSCGISSWESNYGINTIETLFMHADDALYNAKSSGKNQIIKKVLI